jgi:hypothetical protein
MNRRYFLKLFAAAGPVAAVAPTYFFAPVGGWKTRTPAGDAFARFLARMNSTDSVETAAGRQFWYTHPAHKPMIDELFKPVPEELWGLPYYQTKPPYIAETYGGIDLRRPFVVIEQEMDVAEAKRRFPFIAAHIKRQHPAV